MNPPNRQSWIIEVRPEGDGPPAECRVRRLLKAALRTYGLRAVDVSTTAPKQVAKPTKPPPTFEIY